jgi:hypothetical protein
MKISMETITPARAEEILAGNTRNRHLRSTLVSQYASDMVAGRWKETHQGIAINCDGTLLDGQHRLAAIVQSNTTQRMLVATGVPSESQVAMDDHAKRAAHDSLTLDRGETVTATDVAVARGVLRFAGADNRGITKGEVAELLDKLAEPLRFIAPYMATKQRGVTAAPVWSAVVVAWFYVKDLSRLSQFCEVLCGRQIPESDSDKAATMAREWLLRSGASDGGQKHEAFRKVQRAIVAFMEYKPVGKLYGTAVHYPWPLIDPVRE